MASIKYKTSEGYVSIPMSIEAKTNEENGNGIGTCSTSSGTALAVTLSGYELVQNGFVAVTFSNDVPANATLNINSKGAKPIYYKGSAITADTIKADDTVMFCYDGTNYVVTSNGGDGDVEDKIDALSNNTQSSIDKVFGMDASGNFLNIPISNLASVLISARSNRISSLGCTLNSLQNASGTLEIVYGGVTSPYIPVTGGHTITFSTKGSIGFQGKYYLVEFNSSKSKVTEWNYQGKTSRTITLDANTRYVRTTFMSDLLEEEYIKDETTGTYIWGPFNT